ncbi:uncharacterized protein LOC119828209 [Zerene cesonia]|uniref:uncharacterized protein LOC119828209 n=1 Tax=Zerene cesonia TaxID=33412 RepID=UPI0018E57C38|nr:uncharacterized protein LOC119828209 [Zerene cesonia]
MENTNQANTGIVGARKEPSIDPVKAEGIFCIHTSDTSRASVTKKKKEAARLWPHRWGFYKHLREIQEEEAQKIGLNLEEYRDALRSVNCKPEKPKDTVAVEPSPKPLPLTTSGMIGHRAKCTLEKFGRLVNTSRNYPTRPPLPPGQIYDPYKQTLIFLGSVEGNPISYKLPPARHDIKDEVWAQPQQLCVSPYEKLLHIQ